jgi:hypothetical protein
MGRIFRRACTAANLHLYLRKRAAFFTQRKSQHNAVKTRMALTGLCCFYGTARGWSKCRRDDYLRVMAAQSAAIVQA